MGWRLGTKMRRSDDLENWQKTGANPSPQVSPSAISNQIRLVHDFQGRLSTAVIPSGEVSQKLV